MKFFIAFRRNSVDNSIMPNTETVQFEVTPDVRQQFEAAAAKLNLSLPAYFLYLQSRIAPGCDVAQLDRDVREVFGKHGDLMRRLAK